MSRLWDVAVVGAGPAGASAAVAAAQHGASVLLLDRSSFPRDKACGDGIAGEVLDQLHELGVDVGSVVAGYPALHRLCLTAPGGGLVEGHTPRPIHVVPRQVFDARVVGEVQRLGAELHQMRVREVDVRSDEVGLGGGVRARVVIGADGVGSAVRRSLGVRPSGPGTTAIAIRGYAAADPARPTTQQIVMTKAAWPAYAWTFPIGDGRANVGYGQLLRGTPLSREHLLASLDQLLADVGSVERLRAAHLPLSAGRPRVSNGRVLLVGDALGLVNPLSGEGILQAVVSGALAGHAAASAVATEGDAGATYRAALRRRMGRHLRHAALLQRFNRWPALLDAGVRAAVADRGVFDDVVSFGLADARFSGRALRGTVRALVRRPV